MPSIRIRYNGSSVLMNELGVIDNTKALCGNKVDVLRRQGLSYPYRYLGVREYEERTLLPIQYVKILRILTYFPDEDVLYSRGIDLRLDHYCVGIYDDCANGVFLALKDGKPISFPLPNKQYQAKPSNVQSIR